jgi:general secretion pathway protein E
MKVNQPAQGSPKSLRSSGHISDYAMLPEFIGVLSHGEKPRLQLFKPKQNAMAALEVSDGRFVVLALEGEQGGTAWFHLIEQGKRLGLSFAGAHTCSAEILHTLLQENVYEKDAIELNKRREQERHIQARLVSESAPIDWLRSTIGRCLEMGATDIHFEVRGDYTLMRVRLDGIVRKVTHYPTRLVLAGLSAGYTILAEEGSRSEVAFNVLAVQSAMIPLEVNERKVQLRYQSHPAVGGFDAIMRVLRVGDTRSVKLPQLEQLGYTVWQEERIKQASASAWGGIFISGITGSGKTTTLSSLLQRLAATGQRKIVSIEDPVEYQIPGVTHLSIRRQVSESSKNPFEGAMMAFLRMDPDVGMFGEIRDRLSAQMAQAAIQTGHKLLTTVHATSALGIVARLTSQQIGLVREDVCSPEFLSLLMYQTLVPRNCPHCQVPAEQAMELETLRAFEHYFKLDTAAMRCASDTGCPHCRAPGLDGAQGRHIGVKGVKVCAEVIPVTHELLRHLRNKDDMKAREHWLSLRQSPYDSEEMQGKEAWGHALYEVSRGVLDPYHFELSFGPPALLVQSRGLN